MFNELLEEDPFIQEKKAKGRAEGLQEAVLTIIEARFPPLTELAQKKIPQITHPETLRFILRSINAAPDEATTRLLLEAAA